MTVAALHPALAAVPAALFLWWFSTGALLWLARLGSRRGSPGGSRGGGAMGGVTIIGTAAVLLAASLWGSAALAGEATVAAAYTSFLCGLGAWGFVELTFLTGFLAGPVTRPCPVGATGRRRFGLALGTVLWHEIAILAVGGALLATCWGAVNQTGAWAYILLMAMRVSAKLNLFLGVPYPPTAMLSRPLSHLESYFRVRRFSALLPIVITAATALATLVAWRAATPGLDAFHATAYALFWTLLVLGIAEHWFLILPVRESVLWRWFLEREPRSRPASTAAQGRGQPSRTGAHAPSGSYLTGATHVAGNEEGGASRPRPA
ncbi:MAG: putative photosynthetic complex assembly protein PuhE [Pseudomonadota bacterium]